MEPKALTTGTAMGARQTKLSARMMRVDMLSSGSGIGLFEAAAA
jgi:hypothetical protein